MMHKRDIIGRKFGRLTVIGDGGKHKSGHYQSLVKCDCGKEFLAFDSYLIIGKTKKCIDCHMATINKKHGLAHTRIYNIWVSMKSRCYNKNNREYKRYGGRGITVCEEWLDKENGFVNFKDWAFANGYVDDLTIDRIDVNGNYEPSNCRWATLIQQGRNKRNTNYVEYNGERVSVREVAEKCGIEAGTIISRLKHGWNDYDATHIKPNTQESYRNSKNNAARKIAIITNLETGEVMEFDSYSNASRFLGHNVGYINNRISRLHKNVFETRGYRVEATERSNKVYGL